MLYFPIGHILFYLGLHSRLFGFARISGKPEKFRRKKTGPMWSRFALVDVWGYGDFLLSTWLICPKMPETDWASLSSRDQMSRALIPS